MCYMSTQHVPKYVRVKTSGLVELQGKVDKSITIGISTTLIRKNSRSRQKIRRQLERAQSKVLTVPAWGPEFYPQHSQEEEHSLGRWRQRMPEACWPDSLDKPASSRFSKGHCLKKITWTTMEEDIWCWPLASPNVYTLMSWPLPPPAPSQSEHKWQHRHSIGCACQPPSAPSSTSKQIHSLQCIHLQWPTCSGP